MSSEKTALILKVSARLIFACCAFFGAVLASGSFASGSPTRVQIPLNKADSRYVSFYVPTLGSLLYRPATTAPVGTIIFLHGCGQGWFDDQVSRTNETDYAEHFANLGYATLLLGTADDRKLNQKPCTNGHISFTLAHEESADLDAAVSWVIANKIADPTKIVAIGSSLGGATVLRNAKLHYGKAQLAGAISFYPGCTAEFGEEYARYPVLILVGALDDSGGVQGSGPRFLSDVCQTYAKRANARLGSKKIAVISYPASGHNFDFLGLAPYREKLGDGFMHLAGYNAAAAQSSLQDIDKFLADVFH